MDVLLKSHDLPIAATLKARRKKLGLTLQQLAEKSGLSAPFLSQAERGLATPSIVSLMNLARALGVDVNDFIQVPKGQKIVRRADEPERINAGSPVDYVRLSAGLADQKMDALMITIPPKLVFPRVQREGEGFYYILQGKLHFEVADNSYELGVGDTIHFNQRLQYTMQNRGRQMVKMLWVGTPVLFQEED